MPWAFRLESVRQRYGGCGRTVLDLDRLEVRRGEILALVGPSGSGKSTLLRLLNFLEQPTEGTILYEGRPTDGEHTALELRRQVTTVFQQTALQKASVRANVAYGLRLRGLPVDGQVQSLLQTVGLGELAGASARLLSGGEKQRVALARALIFRPRVLLLDEPTANLDPYNVGFFKETAPTENQKHGTTVVLVTHNVFQAHRLAHRTGLILNGRLVELADTAAFFSSPADPRTAAFVSGEMVY